MKADKKIRLHLFLARRRMLLFCIGICLSQAVNAQQYPPKTGPI
jgi:hypothetical protein